MRSRVLPSCFALCLSLLACGPAAASGALTCTISDSALSLSLEGTFSHGVGEGLVSVGGTLEIRSKAVRTTRVDLQREHITQYWMAGPELNLRVYYEPTEGPHEEIDVVIETRQPEGSEPDEPSYEGSYTAQLYRADESDGNSEKLEGRVSCSAGF